MRNKVKKCFAYKTKVVHSQAKSYISYSMSVKSKWYHFNLIDYSINSHEEKKNN